MFPRFLIREKIVLVLNLCMSAISLRILALFTSVYNGVGTGDSEYRLGRVVLRHFPPPPPRGAGGGSVVVITDLFHPPTRFDGRRPAGCRPPVRRGLLVFVLCSVHPL